MKRTIETIMPTLKALEASKDNENHSEDACNVIINGFYFESEVSFAFSMIIQRDASIRLFLSF